MARAHGLHSEAGHIVTCPKSPSYLARKSLAIGQDQEHSGKADRASTSLAASGRTDWTTGGGRRREGPLSISADSVLPGREEQFSLGPMEGEMTSRCLALIKDLFI